MLNLLVSFEGRLNRAKWWLINIGMSVVYVIVAGAIAGSAAMSSDPEAALAAAGPIGGLVLLVVTLTMIWIGLAVAAKRWHDRGKSAWWILIAFVPVIGSLWYLIECGFLRGTAGANRFGADPLRAL